MDKKQLAQMMDSIAKVYPKFLLTNAVMSAWYDYVGDLDYDQAREAVRRYVRENEFPPTVAGIMHHYREIDRERSELYTRLCEDYNIITGLYPGGGSAEAAREYEAFIGRFPMHQRKIVSQRLARCVADFVNKAAGDVPSLAEYIRGLNEQAGASRSDAPSKLSDARNITAR